MLAPGDADGDWEMVQALSLTPKRPLYQTPAKSVWTALPRPGSPRGRYPYPLPLQYFDFDRENESKKADCLKCVHSQYPLLLLYLLLALLL